VRHILRLQAQIKDDFSSKVNYTAFLE
jgi:hypothetical protein